MAFGSPFGNIIDRNRLALGTIGSNLLSGSFMNAGQGVPQAIAVDQARVQGKQKENQTRAWLQSQNLLSPELSSFLDIRPDLAGEFVGELWKQKISGGATTDDLREYGQAVGQGFKGTFLDYQMKLRGAGAPKTIGAIEPGMRLKYDEAGNPVSTEPIPGSEAERKLKAAAEAAKIGEQTKQQTADIVTTEVDRTLGLVKSSPGWTTGVGAWLTQDIPGFPAKDAKALVDTIKANVGFDKIQDMRKASPTGAALGQVQVQEIKFLQQTIGDLELSNSKEMVEYNLKRVKNAYLDIVHGPGQGPPREILTLPGGGGGKPGAEDPMGLR